MKLLFYIAMRHVLARKRQSLVSLMGIVLGVAFFLAISSIMQGSQKDFIKRLVDNSPHITISDEFRTPRQQPLEQLFPHAALEMKHVKPVEETRGIRGYKTAIEYMITTYQAQAAAVQAGQGLLHFAGRDYGVTLNGMSPQSVRDVTTIQEHMVMGSVDDLISNREGVIVGLSLTDKLSIRMGDTITLASAAGQVKHFKVVGLFQTGREDYDASQVFMDIKRVQSLLNRPDRANRIIIKLPDYTNARDVATALEARFGYKAVSWQEASEDLMNTLAIRNIIMYAVVSAVLVVAAFGIYNVISTVVLEKQRDIAILKSMGFTARDIKRIFLSQGVVLGVVGCGMGVPLGMGFMVGLMQIRFKPPGLTEPITMPVDWSLTQFMIAIAFAMSAAMFAAWLPAAKAAKVQPVDILRGGT